MKTGIMTTNIKGAIQIKDGLQVMHQITLDHPVKVNNFCDIHVIAAAAAVVVVVAVVVVAAAAGYDDDGR